MKSLKVALLGLLLLPALGWAEARIAVLDMDGVIRSSKLAEDLREQLRQEFADEELALRKLSEEGNALKAKFEKESDFMSAGDREIMLGQIKNKYEEFQALGNQIKQQTQDRERAFLDQLRPQVEEVLRELVAEQKIDIILNRRAAIYINPEMDLSAAVLERLNQQ
ncbi:OmpH family outer membrane protein [Motiliproteus sediminis]|uniref:OmpH family outer membrane protein n=1 Tax=Motiliproteus sediminis TaxID=1468178 RepID=UPI001AEFB81A|nr:OmpH family outer membrane protein [Motiliproteus sediminis]